MPTAIAADPQAIIREAIKNVTALATLPEVTTQIIKVVEDPRSSAGKLHKIISHDPALVTRILKVVNSSFYGLPGQIASVDRAIVLLGLNAVKNIAVAASLGQLFRGTKLCEGYSARDLWTHCVAVGVAGRQLAKLMKLPCADEVFLAGMIHDVGILVELQTWPEKLREVCNTVKGNSNDFCETERQILSVDHPALGLELARQWKFPEACQMAAGFHHQPGSVSETHRQLVSLVFVADTLCCQAGQGFSLTARNQQVDAETLAGLGIERDVIEHLSASLPQLLSDAGAIAA